MLFVFLLCILTNIRTIVAHKFSHCLFICLVGAVEMKTFGVQHNHSRKSICFLTHPDVIVRLNDRAQVSYPCIFSAQFKIVCDISPITPKNSHIKIETHIFWLTSVLAL